MIKLTEAEVEALKNHGGDWGGDRQGDIFKSVKAFESGVGVCYIPEGMDDEGYTRQDFLDQCGGNPAKAVDLFICVDWQNPESCYIEDDTFDDEYYQDSFDDGRATGLAAYFERTGILPISTVSV